MAIKLEIYLKRTGQSLGDWMAANDITNSKDLVPRCSYLGLAATRIDAMRAEEHFRKQKRDDAAVKKAEDDAKKEAARKAAEDKKQRVTAKKEADAKKRAELKQETSESSVK